MKYCPECEEEYREGVNECWVCQVPLVPKVKTITGPRADPFISLIDVWICDGEAEAQVVASLLTEEKIDCMLKGEALRYVHGFKTTLLGRVHIQVREDDYERALSSIRASQVVKMECANCGSLIETGVGICPHCSVSQA